MKTAVIAARQNLGRGLAPRASSVIVTPRTLDALRGHVIDEVIFDESADAISGDARSRIAEAVRITSVGSPAARTVAEQLKSWLTAGQESGGSES